MTYRVTNLLSPQPIEEVSTTKHFAFGTICQGIDPDYGNAEFIYAKGVSSGAQYAWVTYNMDDGSTTLLAANAVGPVGVMMSALDATTDFGWVCIAGKVIGKALTQFADNAQVWITGTAGSIDDTSVAGDLVNNAKGASAVAVGAGQCDFEISRPWVDNISSAT